MAAATDGCKTQVNLVRLNLTIVDEGNPVRRVCSSGPVAVCCAGVLLAPKLYQESSNCILCRVSSSPTLALPAIQFPVHPSFSSSVVSPAASSCPSLPITSGFRLRLLSDVRALSTRSMVPRVLDCNHTEKYPTPALALPAVELPVGLNLSVLVVPLFLLCRVGRPASV